MSDALVKAVWKGDLEAVQALSTKPDANPNMRTPTGEPLLNYAARMQDPTCIRLLLEAGAVPSLTDNHGRSALHNASAGSAAGVRMLLAAGADPGARDCDGLRAIDVALAVAKSAEVLRLLVPDDLALDEGRRFDHQILMRAAATGELASVEDLVARATAFELVEPLSEAARHGNLQSAQLLLAAGASPNHCDSRGRNALHQACAEGRSAMVDYLLDAGADPQTETTAGERPAHLLLGSILSNREVIRLLERMDALAPDYLSLTRPPMALAEDAVRHARMHLAAKLGAANALPDCDAIGAIELATFGALRLRYLPGEEALFQVEEDIGRGEWYPVGSPNGPPNPWDRWDIGRGEWYPVGSPFLGAGIFDLAWLADLIERCGNRPGCEEIIVAYRQRHGRRPPLVRIRRLPDR